MYSNNKESRTFIASGDLSGMQNRVVDLLGSFNKVGHALAGGGFGILDNKPQNGEHATVNVEGELLVRVGAAVTAGQFGISAASGWAIAHVASTQVASGAVLTSQVVLGRFLTTAASGMLATIEFNPQLYSVNSI